MKKIGFYKIIIAGGMLVTAIPSSAQFPRENFLGVFAGPARLGCMHIVTEKTEISGKAAYKIESILKTRMNVLGNEVSQEIKSTVFTNEEFSPIREIVIMSSGGSLTRIEANFNGDKVECELSSGDSVTRKTLDIPYGKKMIGDAMVFGPGGIPEIGAIAEAAFFNPLTLQIETVKIETLRRETVELPGLFSGETLVVKSSTRLGDITTWLDSAGEIVKAQSLMGITMVRESPEKAVSSLEKESNSKEDFAEMTSVNPNRDIPDPRNLKYLKIRLSNLPSANFAITDGRQKVVAKPQEDGYFYADIEINARPFPLKKSVSLPIKDPGLAHYLEESPYINAKDPLIRSLVKEIKGNETKAYETAVKISKWVNANMQSQADIGVVRSAVEVLKSKRGVCRDYAILFTALARAAGIPTRLAAGLVYMNGAFYYHVWAESFVGSWFAFDPTIGGDFVDATHVKLTQGETDSLFDMAKVIGGLKAEIKGFSHGK